jgi:rubrerythrin
METRAKVKNILNILINQTKKKTIESIIQSLNNPLNTKHKPVVDVIIKTTNYLPQNTLLKERIYHIINDLFEIPICEICKTNHPKFVDSNIGYRQFCSQQCSQQVIGKKLGEYSKNHKEELLEKRTITNLKKYGVANVSKIKEINQLKSNTWKNKSKEEVQQIVNSRQETLMDHFGVTSPSKNEAIKEKIKQTNFERYGVTTTLNTDSCRQKTTNAIITKMTEIMEKRKKTNLEKYGVEHAFQKKTFLEKKRKKFFNDLLISDRLKNHYVPNFKEEDYDGVDKYYEWKCLKCNTVFQYKINNGMIPRCPTCYPIEYLSKSGQIKIVDFCREHFEIVYENSRNLIPPYEIDIYIPEIKLGIEFNGLYWHSELAGNKESIYHQNKLLLALQNQINLVQIFEDEWRDQEDIIKSILLNKFNKNTFKIFARKCQIYSVPVEVAQHFYFDNHLQGFINGKHLGLYHNNEFVSMMTVGRPRFNTHYDLEIYRFCNKLNTSVIGGLSKLLNAFINMLNPKSILTYTDGRYGIGTGYYKCGFKFIGTTDPAYYYMKYYNNRNPRFQFQKHLLKDKLKDFDNNLTEWENMQLNGYDRIWDCGNFVYELIL